MNQIYVAILFSFGFFVEPIPYHLKLNWFYHLFACQGFTSAQLQQFDYNQAGSVTNEQMQALPEDLRNILKAKTGSVKPENSGILCNIMTLLPHVYVTELIFLMANFPRCPNMLCAFPTFPSCISFVNFSQHALRRITFFLFFFRWCKDVPESSVQRCYHS